MEFMKRPRIIFVCSKCGHEQPHVALVKEVDPESMNGHGEEEKPIRWRAYVCADKGACEMRQRHWRIRLRNRSKVVKIKIEKFVRAVLHWLSVSW